MRLIFITGATRGIGHAIGMRLAAEGANIVIAAKSTEENPKLVLEQLVEIARRHDLTIFADEIYDQVIYDEATHIPIASLVSDILCVTFNGLSKNYRSAGFRTGWLMLSGAKQSATSYVEGLDMLASMRLCANVPAQYAIQTALGGHQSIHDLTRDTGRLLTQRNLAWELLTAIPGVSCVKPKGGFYLFPKLDPHLYPIQDCFTFINIACCLQGLHESCIGAILEDLNLLAFLCYFGNNRGWKSISMFAAV